MRLEIQNLVWDRHKNVYDLQQQKRRKHSTITVYITVTQPKLTLVMYLIDNIMEIASSPALKKHRWSITDLLNQNRVTVYTNHISSRLLWDD